MYSARRDYSGVEEWIARMVRAEVKGQPPPDLDLDRRLWLNYLLDVRRLVAIGFPIERLDVDTVRGLMAIENGERNAKGDMMECPNCGGLSISLITCDRCKQKMPKKGK